MDQRQRPEQAEELYPLTTRFYRLRLICAYRCSRIQGKPQFVTIQSSRVAVRNHSFYLETEFLEEGNRVLARVHDHRFDRVILPDSFQAPLE